MTPTESPTRRPGEANRQARPRVADVTVVIPTVGRPTLAKCLESIASGTALPAQVVVIDQGQNPAVAGWLRDVQAIGLDTFHLISSDRSPASARNRGVELVRTPFVAGIDDDCTAAADWLQKMAICLHQHSTAIVTGRLLPAGDGIPPTIVTSSVPRVHTRPSMRFPSPLASANMGFALETAGRIGPFDENLAEAEENDWAYRALRAGIPIVFAPELVVNHVHWRSNAQVAAVYRAYARSQGAFYGKHLRGGDWSMAVRTADYVVRNGHVMFKGLVTNDVTKRDSGYSKITRLLSGVFAGLRGQGSR